MKESQVADLQKNIKSQQSKTSKAKSELTTALEEMEKLKKEFKAQRNGWDTEKAALVKREEEARACVLVRASVYFKLGVYLVRYKL